MQLATTLVRYYCDGVKNAGNVKYFIQKKMTHLVWMRKD